MTKRALQVKETRRRRLADYRKQTLVQSGHVYRDVANLAEVSWSMADKWMNARRASRPCERAFRTLTGKTAIPDEVAA